jgi:hypothetical protein
MEDTFSIGQCTITLISGRIETDPAMGMVYGYRDIPGVTVHAVACTSSFRGIDITRAVSRRFNLRNREFQRAGKECNDRRELCVFEHDPIIILTPRVALLERYTVDDAAQEMTEILAACHQEKATVLRLCHFAMPTSEKPFEHLNGVRDSITAWPYEAAIYIDVPSQHIHRIKEILTAQPKAI